MTLSDSGDFWAFSLKVYASPGVAEVCLRLQDRHGADVNLLLYAGWIAASGCGALAEEALRALIGRTEVWQAEVVRPLRAVRRGLTARAAEDATVRAFREQVKALELEAERIEQADLQQVPRLERPGQPASARRHDASTAIACYLAILDARLTLEDHQAIDRLAAACVEA